MLSRLFVAALSTTLAATSVYADHNITIWNRCDFNVSPQIQTGGGVNYTGPQPPNIQYDSTWSTIIPTGWIGRVSLNGLAEFSLDQSGVSYYDLSFPGSPGYNPGLAIIPASSDCDTVSCSDSACACDQAYFAPDVEVGEDCSSSPPDAPLRSCSVENIAYTVKICPKY